MEVFRLELRSEKYRSLNMVLRVEGRGQKGRRIRDIRLVWMF